MSVLKLCPFCGSDKVDSDISNGAAFIFCREEGCSNLGLLMENEPFLDDIEMAWNKRPREDQLEKEIATLKSQLKEAEFIAELGNCISEQGRAYAKAKGVPFKNCAEAVLIDRWKIYRETVKAKGL